MLTAGTLETNKLNIMETVSLNAPSKAAKRYKEVIQTKVSPIMHASPAAIWEIIGPGFADVHRWSTALDYSSGSGEPTLEGATCSERYCELNAQGFDKISEKLVIYDEFNRTLAYRAHHGLPGFITFAQNRWRVLDAGQGQSQLEMTLTMRLKPLLGTLIGPFFQRYLNKTIDSVMADLKIFAETGEISAAKKARLAELARKK